MAVSIQSAKFSFHRFEPVDYVLPAYRAFDAAFQFHVNGFLPITSDIRLRVLDYMGIVHNPFSVETLATILAYKFKIPNAIFNQDPAIFINSIAVNDIEKNYNGVYTYKMFKDLMYEDFGYTIGIDNTFISRGFDEIVIRWGPSSSTIYENTLQAFWGRGYVAAIGDYIAPLFKPGECFSYCLIDPSGTVIGKTNKMQVITRDKFTSLMTYENNEDAFEFFYDDTPNIVRLPFYLSRPQWPEKKTVYVKSDGQHKLLSSFIEETYELRTEHLPAKMHRFIKLAFGHDSVVIDCSNMDETPVQVVNSDSYNPTWDSDIDLNRAPGKSTLTVAAFGYNNSNFEQEEVECSPPLMTLGLITESSARFEFQAAANVKYILINYRRVGTSEWQGSTFAVGDNYLITGLYAGYDYEAKAASNCGTSYAGFGRTKTFKTLGAVGCTPPHDLGISSIDVDHTFNFQVYLPLPAPAEIELFHMRPDGSVTQQIIDATSFTTNPFAFEYLDSNTLQLGLNRFKVRSVCGPTDKSAWSNEIISNFQESVIETNIQNEFQLFAGGAGSLIAKRNGTTAISTTTPFTTTFNGAQGDLIDVNVSSSNGAPAYLKVYYQDLGFGTTTVLFDSATSTSPIQSFSFSVNINNIYFITASI